MLEQLIRKRALETIALIPKGYRTDSAVKETIRCVLFNILREEGWIAVPSYRVPRYPEGPVDMVGMDPGDYTIHAAFSIGPLVELAGVKSLDRVDTEHKYMITFSQSARKVKESAFFLKPGIGHIHLYEDNA